MSISALHGLDQLSDNVRRRWLIWITHPKINNVFTSRSCGTLQGIGNTKDIGGKALNSLKFFVHGLTQKKPRV
jgi:hypothetical protein